MTDPAIEPIPPAYDLPQMRRELAASVRIMNDAILGKRAAEAALAAAVDELQSVYRWLESSRTEIEQLRERVRDQDGTIRETLRILGEMGARIPDTPQASEEPQP